MTKHLFALAAAALSASSFAQGTYTIQGSIASAFERSTLAGSQGSITGYDPTVNFITFKGTEDLGGGLKLSFELNTRFNSGNGTLFAGRAFENSFLTLLGGFGDVKIGRHQAISVAAFDIYIGQGADFGVATGPTAARDLNRPGF